MNYSCLRFLTVFNVFWELSKSPIKTFFIWIVVIPPLCCFDSVLDIIIFGLVGFSLKMESLVIWSESRLWVTSSDKRFFDFSFMSKPLLFLNVLLIIIGTSLVLIATKQMPICRTSESPLHIISSDIFLTSFNISSFISRIVSLIIKLLHVLKLRVLSKLNLLYTNFWRPPAWKAWLCIDKSVFYLL